MPLQPLGAQIPKMLRARGVEVIFGIPGVHNQEMYRGIQDAGLKHVLARHEQGAGFMADGYARATGQPGMAFVITGPGLTNIMTPIGQAYSDSVPMIVFSSALANVGTVQGQLHQMKDQRLAGGCVADWSIEARSAEEAYDLIDRALAEFAYARKRPKHIQIPIPVLQADAAAPPPPPPAQNTTQNSGDLALEPVLRAELEGKSRPLIIFGGGTQGVASQGLAARLGAASFTTYAGRGAVETNDPLAFGPMLGRPESRAVIGSADLVIAIGTELAEVDLWRDDLGHQAPLVRIDIDPLVLTDRHKADVRLAASAQNAIEALFAVADDRPRSRGWSKSEVTAAKTRWRNETDAERPGIAPIVDALHRSVPRDTIIFSDMTQFAYVAKEIYPLERPGQWHHPTGFGTLGYALPAAIGGKVGCPDRPVLAIAGDYGFQYTVQELGTAAELGLCLPILLWDNAALAEIRDSMIAAQIAPNAVELRNPDFAALAQAYGVGYARPASIAEFEAELQSALTGSCPTIVHVTPQVGLG